MAAFKVTVLVEKTSATLIDMVKANARDVGCMVLFDARRRSANGAVPTWFMSWSLFLHLPAGYGGYFILEGSLMATPSTTNAPWP